MNQSTEDYQLSVIARAPFHVYYEGKAQVVSAANKVGKFDILPGHADFFSVLIPGDVTVETASDKVVFNVNNGIMTARNNEVMIFANM
jgi:F-type H+-transporting ATPase subunit epsilon